MEATSKLSSEPDLKPILYPGPSRYPLSTSQKEACDAELLHALLPIETQKAKPSDSNMKFKTAE